MAFNDKQEEKKPRRSFFERLTGVVNVDKSGEEDDIDIKDSLPAMTKDEEMSIGELSVDVFEAPDSVIVKAMVAGVKPEDLDVAITRQSVTVRGHRTEEHSMSSGDYITKELYWGEFARTVSFPVEVDPDMAEASERHGLLIIKIPKIDKNKETRLRVRTN